MQPLISPAALARLEFSLEVLTYGMVDVYSRVALTTAEFNRR
jgi:hypothetical protein